MPENPETFDAGQSTYSVTLPSFEGPLDLLLHLCQKHELNILDIPIAFVTSKYLEYLAVMQLMNLDVASEYLLMAATLAHIKSKMLLPAPPPGQEDDVTEEEEDPREALIRRLLEYQKYKQAAADLSARGVAGRDIFMRGAPIEESVHTGLAPLADVPLYSLVEAFQSILSRTKVKLTHDIVADRISITDRIHELSAILQGQRRVTFESLFTGISTKFDLVITFLALLEMSKLRMTRLFQTEPLAPIYVELAMRSEDGGEEDRTFDHGDMNARPEDQAAYAHATESAQASAIAAPPEHAHAEAAPSVDENDEAETSRGENDQPESPLDATDEREPALDASDEHHEAEASLDANDEHHEAEASLNENDDQEPTASLDENDDQEPEAALDRSDDAGEPQPALEDAEQHPSEHPLASETPAPGEDTKSLDHAEVEPMVDAPQDDDEGMT